MHFSPLALLCAATCALSPALAQAELSFNLGVVSLYKSNGLDQDNPKGKSVRPAVQGGVDKVFDNGFYLGNWNSTGRFGDADIEIDLYGGHRGQLGADLSYDVGLVSFIYPGSGGGWNGNEAYASLSYGPFTVKVARGVSGVIDGFGRLSLAYTRPLTETLKLQASVGTRNNTAGNFSDYSVGLNHDFGRGLSAGLSFAGTTKKDQLGGAGDNRLVASLVKGF
ncbi:MAG: TorF family putative porin [Hydrogenophaga sp.]|nr:TorF family putative porin [Hydrogenophaga sp.]